jgi:hypothetical protein
MVFMKIHHGGYRKFITVLAMLVSLSLTSVAAEKVETFVLTVSLPATTIHEGDLIVMDVTTTNPTDHVVVAAEGRRGGLGIELMNEKGDDIGLAAMGISESGNHDEPAGVLTSSKMILRPGSKDHFIWHFKPKTGYVVPGVYKLRVHQRDVTSRVIVYSNTVVLTVIP